MNYTRVERANYREIFAGDRIDFSFFGVKKCEIFPKL